MHLILPMEQNRSRLLRSSTSLFETNVILGMWPSTSSLMVHHLLSRATLKRQDSASSLTELFVWDSQQQPKKYSEFLSISLTELAQSLMLLEQNIFGTVVSSTLNSFGREDLVKPASMKIPCSN